MLNKASLLWHNAEFYGCSLVLLTLSLYSLFFFPTFFFCKTFIYFFYTIVTSSAIFLHNCGKSSSVFSVLLITIFCQFSALIKSFIACTIELLILLHSFFCSVASYQASCHGNTLIITLMLIIPIQDIPLICLPFHLREEQYFSLPKLQINSWNYGLAHSTDNFNAIMFQLIHMKYKAIKISNQCRSFFCPPSTGMYVWTLKKICEMQK